MIFLSLAAYYHNVNYLRVGPPGKSIIKCKTIWNELNQSEDLAKLVAKCHSPEHLAKHLLANGYAWKRDYDIRQFLSPSETVSKKGGVCSAYGRLWVYMLANMGIKSDLIAIYSIKSAHAITVFLDPITKRYKLTSNQFLYKVDLGTDREEAIRKAADEFYSSWLAIEVYGEDGTLREVINSVKGVHYPTVEEVEFDITR